MSEHFINIEDARADLLACAAFLGEIIKSADGHSEAMNAVVPYYLEKGEVDLAAEFANTVDDPFSRDKLLILVAEKCASIDDDEYALQLVEAVEDYGLQLQGLEKLVQQKAFKGDFDKAFDFADRLQHNEFAHAEIAIRKASAGDETGAAEIIENIEFPSAKVAAFVSIAANLIAKESNEKAVELLNNAASESLNIEHAEEKIRALNDIGNLFIEAKRNDRAIETFDKAKSEAVKLDNTHKDYLLASASLGFFKAGSVDLADRTLDLVADKTQISSVLVGFSREYWSKDEKNEAVEALEEAYAVLKSQHERETRDSKAKFGLLTTIAVQFAQYEKPERALEIAQTNPSESEETSALQQIAQVYALRGKDDLIEQTLKAIREDSDRMFAQIAVSDAKERIEKREDAVKFLTEAANLAETVPQLSLRSSALNEIAARFIKYGNKEKARELSHENLEIIEEIRDDSIRSVALANLSEVYTAGNFELNEAEKTTLYTMIRKAEM
ncbi:MAG TPA: hypothetical protein PKY59_12905 [Pyrinomonadaceae bacterium]|nr:hypothetical protein [Pyrinomonadaceae bacterium]